MWQKASTWSRSLCWLCSCLPLRSCAPDDGRPRYEFYSFIPPFLLPFPHPFLHPSSASLALCADSSSHRVTAGRDLLGLLSFRLGTDSMDGLVFSIYLLIYLFSLLYCGISFSLFIISFLFQSSATDCYSIVACQPHFHKERKIMLWTCWLGWRLKNISRGFVCSL